MTFEHCHLGATIWALKLSGVRTFGCRRLGARCLGTVLCVWHIIEITILCISFELKLAVSKISKLVHLIFIGSAIITSYRN